MKKIHQIIKMYAFNFKLSMYHRLIGIDIGKMYDYLNILERLPKKKKLKVLDVGSWKSIFPLYLSYLGHNVTVNDIDKQKISRIKKMSFRIKRPIKSLFGNINKINTDERYDVITAISTIEHFDNDGDIKAVLKIKLLLKKGGTAFITVPYTTKKSGIISKGKWFERIYDYKTLKERIANNSEIVFMMDSKISRITNVMYSLPKILRFMTQPFHILLVLHYFDKDKANKKNAGSVLVIIKK